MNAILLSDLFWSPDDFRYNVGDVVSMPADNIFIGDADESLDLPEMPLVVLGRSRDCDGSPLYHLGWSGVAMPEDPSIHCKTKDEARTLNEATRDRHRRHMQMWSQFYCAPFKNLGEDSLQPTGRSIKVSSFLDHFESVFGVLP